jgi:hypothetical protein
MIVAIVVSGCAPQNPRDRAIDSAHTSWRDADAALRDVLPQLPSSGFREYIVEAGALGASPSLLDADEATLREYSYQLQSPASYVLDASETGSVATALMYFAGAYEGGGGLDYQNEIVFSCATVRIDLAGSEVLGYEPADCGAVIYAVVGTAGEVDFEAIGATS